VLRYGASSTTQVVDENQHLLLLPAELLQEISIVDTPGTNAIFRAHEALTSQYVPRADLVLFVTSADRPFTESERAFLEQIRDWGKKVVIVINKTDILQSEADLDKVSAFVRENARSLLGMTPPVLALSARLAMRAKQGETALWPESRFAAFEKYLHDTLDETERLRLKFINPLGVGMHLVQHYLDLAEARLALLKADFAMLADVDAELALYQRDLKRDFALRMADIENVLLEMKQRGDAYFDETLRLARVLDLLNKERIQREFGLRVVADVPQQIERKVVALIDWLVEADLRQWKAVTAHLAERRRAHEERLVGDTDGFQYDRVRLMEQVGREAQQVVESYDKTREAETMAEGARMAVAAAAAIGVGAIGLGTLLTVLASTLVADVTGVLVASAVAVLGLFIIPRRRRQAKAEMGAKVSALREQLVRALRPQFEREIARSVQHINQAIAPYTRFVRAQRDRLAEGQSELHQLQGELGRLKGAAEEMRAD
jgi:hypothetical protein